MKTKHTLPQVALVGRTNVGKSTLFNRILGAHGAVVSEKRNTTRDRNIARAHWRGIEFDVVDTGGFDVEKGDEFGKDILAQAQIAINKADVILFMVDATVGIVPDDAKIAKFLRTYQKKVLVVANKLDKPKERQVGAHEFLKLGFGEVLAVSAVTGGGTGELLEMVLERFPKKKIIREESTEKEGIRVAIVGKPNVGKSSLLNAILGEERVIISDIPHTTREPINTRFCYKEQEYVIADTAGIRKRTKIPDLNTKKGIEQTLRALEDVDVVLFVVEAHQRISAQDARVAAEILERGASIILVVNKWDLITEKETYTMKEFDQYFRAQFPYISWVPMIFVSAKEGQRVKKVLELAAEVYSERTKVVDAKKLDNSFTKIIKMHRPPKDPNGKRIYIYGISQVHSNPPVFEMRRKGKTKLQESYVRFIENRLREKFGFIGTAIHIKVRSIA